MSFVGGLRRVGRDTFHSCFVFSHTSESACIGLVLSAFPMAFTEKWIELVKIYPILYDLSHEDYKNVKDKAWEQIGVELKESGKWFCFIYWALKFNKFFSYTKCQICCRFWISFHASERALLAGLVWWLKFTVMVIIFFGRKKLCKTQAVLTIRIVVSTLVAIGLKKIFAIFELIFRRHFLQLFVPYTV